MEYMSKHCPKYGCIVIYVDCLECEDKICKRRKIENGKGNPGFMQKLEGRYKRNGRK